MPEYVRKIIKQAITYRHEADQNDDAGDFVELTEEMKSIISTSKWTSSKQI